MPVIAGIEITTDDQGRFSLNALHRASGGKKTKQPSDWLKLKGTEELIVELSRSEDLRSAPVAVKKGGQGQGTFAHEILAVEYAGWVSQEAGGADWWGWLGFPIGSENDPRLWAERLAEVTGNPEQADDLLRDMRARANRSAIYQILKRERYP